MGGVRDARLPPSVQNFFIFMQFSEKIVQIIGLRPPLLELAPPPLGNPGSATVIDNSKSTVGYSMVDALECSFYRDPLSGTVCHHFSISSLFL